MKEEHHHASVLNVITEFDQTNELLLFRNTTFHSVNNLDTSQSDSEQNSLHSVKNNSQNNFILTEQQTNILEKKISLKDKCMYLKTSFISLCNYLNILRVTIDNEKIREKDIMNFVDTTTCMLQEKIRNISDIIDDLLKKENIAAKQSPEVLKKKKIELYMFKPNLEECTQKIKNLKIEDDTSLNEFNDYYISTCSESISKKNNHSLNCSSFKRNSSPLGDIGNSIIKKRKTTFEISPYQENIMCIQNLDDNDVLNINSNLTSDSKKNQNYKCINKINKVKPGLNAGSTTAIKKMFKIPDDFKHERKLKSVNISKDDS